MKLHDKASYFIRKPGRGPEELIRPTDVEVDSINQWVYILDHDRLVKYDFKGKYIKAYQLGFDSMNMLILETQEIVLDDMIYQVQNPHNLQAYACIEKGKFKHRDRDGNSPITGKVDPKDKTIIDVSFMAESDRFIFHTNKKHDQA